MSNPHITEHIKHHTQWIFQEDVPMVIPAGMDDDLYGAMPGVRSTWLKKIRQSPGHLLNEIENPSPRTPAMRVSSAIHHAVLLGLDKLNVIVIDDELNLNSKEGRAAKENAEEQGKQLIRKETYMNILSMREMLFADPIIGPMFKGALTEVPIAAPVEVGDRTLACKAKLDILVDGDFIMDLKFVASAEVDDFARACYRYGYDLQAHHYLKTWNNFINCQSVKHDLPATMIRPRDKFLLIAMEKEPPFAYRQFMFGDDYTRIGENHWLEACTTLMDCAESGRYPLYPSTIAILKPPQREDERWIEEEL